MTEQTTEEILKQILSLKTDQYQTAEKYAKQTIQSSIGEKPIFNDYKRERVGIMTLMDYLMLILLAVLFIFSVIHVFSWTRLEATQSYNALYTAGETIEGGYSIDKDNYIKLHQITVLGVTEIGMVVLSMFHLYLNRFQDPAPKPAAKIYPIFWFVRRYFFLILASACGVVIFGANLNSGFNPFVSALVPLLTISLSERFSQLFATVYIQNRQIEHRWRSDLEVWDSYNKNPKSHPEYRNYLAGYILDWYKRNPKYRLIDWTTSLERHLVARELYYAEYRDNVDDLLQQLVEGEESLNPI